MPENTPCQICSNSELITIQSSYVFMNSIELNLTRCPECGLVFLNPQPTSTEAENLYSKEYFIRWYGTEKKREFSKNFFRNLLRGNKIKAKASERLLDVGCGMGFFLEVAREWGWHAQGVEISKYAARYCKEHLHFNVYSGTLETANYPKDYFDIITAFDFLEHISNISRFLSEARRILKEDGIFMVLVPNYQSLVFQLDRIICKWMKLPLSNVPEHLTYFTPYTLRRLLEKSSFRIDRLSTVDANDEAEYLVLKGTPRAFLRALLNNVFYLWGKISHRREAIFVMAKKA
ncbi:MAG: class I SAM-dependent methyltransferase [Candidatus Aminicenantes bacterium]